MGRLVIAHHKSYHPYRRDNIERVRRDEEEAEAQEAKEEGRMMLADSEARIDRLRDRAGASKSRKGKERAIDDGVSETNSVQPSASAIISSGGHINLFGDLEQNAITTAARASRTKKDEVTEDDRGVRLAPTHKDLNPWYTEKRSSPQDPNKLDDKQRRDMARKSTHDPLTSITRQLVSASSSSADRRPRSSRGASSADPRQARISREFSERERALALIRRRKREMEGSETPSTVCNTPGYTDMYNRREVEAAHRDRGDYRHRKWDDDDRHPRERSSWGR